MSQQPTLSAGWSKNPVHSGAGIMTLEPIHWMQRVQESIIAANIVNGSLNIEISGGSDNGLFCFIEAIHQDDINYHSGKLRQDDIILEIQGQKVAGYTLNDIKALLNLVSQNGTPVMIKTVRNGEYDFRILKLIFSNIGEYQMSGDVTLAVHRCLL